ncbi:hypothetical protein J8F10_26400 [Gemmata sp. G18]|uniref:Uncharacterized protein n=1 Tax=Gemmata palustris TaxID=2822762 RepID=A0ABS5BYH2_9BACT|nr:hypothetical protein [Gemmata palustris]MBP3958792.1 hypothetical protein [Gemmata palustris]
MRARTFALVALLAASPLVAHAQDFKQFASADGKYKVLFPGAVKTETTDIQAGKDTLKLTLDSVELKGDTTFLVSYIDASDEVAKKPAGPRLEKVRDGNKGEKGKVLDDKEITIAVGEEKFPGRDVLIETPTGFIRNRMVIVGKRLYQVVVQGSKEVVISPSADKFITSFEITK